MGSQPELQAREEHLGVRGGGWGAEQESWEASEPVLPVQFTEGFVMAADFLFFKAGNSPVCCPLKREQATSGSLRCYFSSRCALAKLG